MKRGVWLVRIVAAVMAIALFPSAAFAEGGGERVIDFGTFLEEFEAANYDYDGQGVTVEWSPSSACTDNRGPGNHACKFEGEAPQPDGNNPQRAQDSNAQYQIFYGKGDVSVKNVAFTFVPADFTLCMNSGWAGTYKANKIKNAEFQLQNSGNVSFSNCTFNSVLVGPWGAPSTSSMGDLTIDGCTFNNVYDTYALKDIHALNASITNNTFNSCSGGIYFSAGGDYGDITIQNNTFTDTGQGFADRGLVQFSSAGSYTNATIDISGNTSTGGAGAIRQLNTSITDKVLDLDKLMEDNSFDGNALTKSTYKVGTLSYNGVYCNGTTYKTLQEALVAAKADTSTTEVKIYCRPAADLGAMTHGPVIKNTTIYGYGAKVSNGERDLELDTYAPFLSDETTVTVKDLDGIGAWGQRNTDHEIDLVFENCQDMHRVYFTASDGNNSPINITLDGCSFDGTDDGKLVANRNTTVYSNAPGTITIKDTSFTNIAVGLNINNKSAGTQNITLDGCTFTDCATVGLQANDPTKTYGAPVRVVAQPGAETNLTVTGCTFTTSEGKTQMGNGDILLGDGRFDAKDKQGIVTLDMSDTDANVMVQTTGYFDKDGNIADESKGKLTDIDAGDIVDPDDGLHFIVDKHDETKVVNAKDATCTDEGYTGDKVCVKCGKVVGQGTTIAKLGHVPELVGNKKATCTEDGHTGNEVCKTCGEVLKKGEVIPATGHTSTDFVTNSTHHWKVCSTCKEAFDVEEHAYGTWKVTEEATAEETGSKERVCKTCGYKDVKVLPKLEKQDGKPAEKPGLPSTGDNSLLVAGSTFAIGSALIAFGALKKRNDR